MIPRGTRCDQNSGSRDCHRSPSPQSPVVGGYRVDSHGVDMGGGGGGMELTIMKWT